MQGESVGAQRNAAASSLLQSTKCKPATRNAGSQPQQVRLLQLASWRSWYGGLFCTAEKPVAERIPAGPRPRRLISHRAAPVGARIKQLAGALARKMQAESCGVLETPERTFPPLEKHNVPRRFLAVERCCFFLGFCLMRTAILAGRIAVVRSGAVMHGAKKAKCKQRLPEPTETPERSMPRASIQLDLRR